MAIYDKDKPDLGANILGRVSKYKTLEYGKPGYDRNASVITFSETNITPGVSYTYKIYSYDFFGNLSEPIEITVP